MTPNNAGPVAYTAAATRARGVSARRTTAAPRGMARKNEPRWTQPRRSGLAVPATALEISRPRITTTLPTGGPSEHRVGAARPGRLGNLMFESLSERFEGIFARLRSKGTLRESDVEEVLREIRLALLEADVNYVVVRSMLARIRERAVGTRVHEALNPSQQVVKLVNEALVEALGGETFRFQYASRPPTVVLMAGLRAPARRRPRPSSPAGSASRAATHSSAPTSSGRPRSAAAALGGVGVPVFSQPGDPVEPPGPGSRGPPAAGTSSSTPPAAAIDAR